MFRHFLSTRGAIYGISAHSLNVRKFSYLSIHSVFPATLYRFQVYRESRLYDRTLAKNDRDYEEYEDGIEVASDGLVYPNISLDALNEILSEFYLNYGTTIPPDEWLENNPYHEAQFDDSDDWMGKLK
ncbi:conserved hypothetical protein [Histoplasma capsulatum var. duboisii H88]|uniref:Uncharacterized protein n=1 Tax=Ajellomyces capsulatus (strain H88) TaxID=544711 RepID=F0UA37_AJEC8|nr:conserved hypothetical protein [Histoplasma capsulatum var. duboisii H88]